MLGDLPPVITEEVLADALHVELSDLKRWRDQHAGPVWVSMGDGLVRYLRCDVLDWIDNRRRGGEEFGDDEH